MKIMLEESGARVGEGSEDVLMRLEGEFRIDTDLAPLVRTIERTVGRGRGPRRLLVDASALDEVPPSVLYAVRVLDRRAREFRKTVDLRVRA
jgi:hypothetical protein